MKTFLKVSFPIVTLGLGVLGFILLKASAPVDLPKPPLEKQWPVKVGKVEFKNVQPEILEYGTIISGNDVDLKSFVSGRIVAVGPNYKNGAVIKKGDQLVKVDAFEHQIKLNNARVTVTEMKSKIKATRAEIKSELDLLRISKAQLDLRRRDLARRQKLRKKGSSSKKSADDAEIAFNDASELVATREQSIIKLKGRLEELKASELRSKASLNLAQKNLVDTALIAPFDGFVGETAVSVGQYVSKSDRIAKLIEARAMEVKFKIADSDFPKLFRSTRDFGATLSIDDLARTRILVRWRVGNLTLDFKAIIRRVGAKIELASGGVTIFASLLDLDLKTPLRPGAFVEVFIPGKLYESVVEVPDTAIEKSKNLYILKNNRLVQREISIVGRNSKSVLITGDLNEGSQFVTHIFPEISAGLKVLER